MTVYELQKTEIGKKVISNESLKEEMENKYGSALALFLIKEESLGEKSEYYNMIKTLPETAYDHPVLFDEDELKVLGNSHFNDYLGTLGEDLMNDYQNLKRALPEYNDLYDLRKFAYWRMTIASRINSKLPNSLDALGDEWSFVPLHNMINHAHVHNMELNSKDGGFKFSATRDI